MKLINHTFKEKKYTIKTNFSINKKIILMSDFHFGPKFKKEKVLLILKKVKEINPNFICIPGDLIDCTNILEDENLKSFIIEFITKLACIAKVIISIGNHDNYLIKNKKVIYDSNKLWFKNLSLIKNVFILNNEIIEFEGITFTGLTNSLAYYKGERKNEDLMINELKEKLPKMNDERYNILLCHSPIHVLSEKTIRNTEIKNISLILSGHMHNGVVPPILDSIFKGNKGIFSPDGSWLFFTKLTRGIYYLNNKHLIISGGITKISESSKKILVPLNELFPMSLEIITLI